MPITNPNDLTGISVWLDAQQHVASDNDPVATATDYHTGGGNDFTQATGSLQPLYKANIYNGHPIFRFDGIDDYMSVALTLGNCTIAGVFAHRSGAVSANEFIVSASGTANRSLYVINAATDAYAMYSGANVVSSVALDTSFHSVIAVHNGASSAIWVDATETTGNAGTSGADSPIILGAVSAASGFADIDVGELVICTAVLTAGEITDLRSYFTSHWAAAATVETPVISPAAGTYSGGTTVSITCATSGASIYYTVDGSAPDAADTLYTGAFQISSTLTVKAIGIKSGMTDSSVAEAAYTVTAPSGDAARRLPHVPIFNRRRQRKGPKWPHANS